MILDHIGIAVSDYDKSKTFFDAALKPLNITLMMEVQGWAGYGRERSPQFWFGVGAEAQKPMHLAFAAENREQVRQFYAAAMAAGAKDNGPPGIREHYHAHYYGAFVIGPDGHNVEAVCHAPEA
jgi:catechol 2,3-dioxygenase-like lactoylglutathione lyase family enzyme